MIVVEVILFFAGAQVFAMCLYLGALALLARRSPVPAPLSRPLTRFDVIVPAHDEELRIAETIRSIGAVAYPRGLFRIVVVADNCRDRTAGAALSAGARVIERKDPARRGKGYALAYAFEWSLEDAFADAVVVVDADTVVSRNLLTSLDERVRKGAHAIQCRYGVRNANASWRTRLMHIAFSLFHDVRSLGRERLRLSCGLRGNGMCFTRYALYACPLEAFSVVEDIEYGIELGRRNIRVEYVDEASVHGEMAVGEAASRTQRIRWEKGRSTLAANYGLGLFREAVQRRSPLLFDLAIDLSLPPLSTIVVMLVLGTVAAFSTLGREGSTGVVVPLWIASTPLLLLYLLRGAQCSGRGLKALTDLAWAPWYIVWKLFRLVFASRPRAWVRTTRVER